MIRLAFALVICTSLVSAIGCAPGEMPAHAAPPTSAPPAAGDAAVAAPPGAAPQARPAGEKRQIKSPFVRELLRSLEEMGGDITPEERDSLRASLENADAELEKALGENSRNRIMAANKRRPAFQVWAKNRNQPPAVHKTPKKPGDPADPIEKVDPVAPTPGAVTPPPMAVPMPAPVAPPAVKPMTPAEEDPFGGKAAPMPEVKPAVPADDPFGEPK